jgi:hypothetical protein
MSLKATTFDISIGTLAFNFKDNELRRTVNDAFEINMHAKRGTV